MGSTDPSPDDGKAIDEVYHDRNLLAIAFARAIRLTWGSDTAGWYWHKDWPRKLLAGTENYHVTVVGSNTDEIATVANAVRNCGLEVVRSDVMDTEHQQPFNHFGREISQPDI